MIIPSNYLDYPKSYPFMAALYLSAYTNADSTLLYLPKRTYADIRNPRRIPHLTGWTRTAHTSYLALPDEIPLAQFVVVDDGWAEQSLELVADQFWNAKDAACRVMLHLWYNILFWASYRPGHGFVTTHQYSAEKCGCSVEFATKVTLAMVDAGLIHRKWIGNGLGQFGTCYMAGPANNVDRLLELAENPI